MDKAGRGSVETSGLYQVAIVVHDLEKSVERYQKLLGMGSWQFMSIDDSVFAESTYRGKPVKHRFKVALGMLGAMQIELIQPIEGETIYADFLNKHGEGVHHLGHFRVDNLGEAIKEFEQEGFPCIQSGRTPEGGGYAYMDTVESLGVITELLAGREGPPPAYPGSVWKAWQAEVSLPTSTSSSSE